jgi:hypothetical protein
MTRNRICPVLKEAVVPAGENTPVWNTSKKALPSFAKICAVNGQDAYNGGIEAQHR